MVDRVILPPATSGVHVRVVLELPLDVNVIVGPAAGVLDGPCEDECSAGCNAVKGGRRRKM